MMKIKSTSEEPRYRPYTITHKMRKLSSPVRVNGKEVIRYRAPVITQYLDMDTGEIIEAALLKKNPDVWPTVYSGERVLQREFILASLRKEVRKFALFVLRFRNQRRGITPEVDELVKWYAKYTGQQVCHVRRYVPCLKAAGVIEGSSLLGPLFQIAGNSIIPSVHRSEDFRAAVNFMLILIHKRAENQIETSLPEVTQPRLTVSATMPIKTKVHALLESLLSAGKLEAQF